MARKTTLATNPPSKNGKSNAKTNEYLVKTLDTEGEVGQAISELYASLANGSTDNERIRLMLSTIGKKLNLENLKVRAGVYRTGKRGFFLQG